MKSTVIDFIVVLLIITFILVIFLNIESIRRLDKILARGDIESRGCGEYHFCIDRRNPELTFEECIEIVYECKHGD